MEIFENFDTISYDFYMSTDQERRNEIDDALRQSATDTKNIVALHQILVQSTSVYSLMLSLTLLKEIFTRHWEALTHKEQEEFHFFLFDYLVKNGQKLPKTVLRECLSLYSRILKMSWLNNQKNYKKLFEDFKSTFFSPIFDDKTIYQMNREEQSQLAVGLQLLIVLSEEFNYIIKEREVLLKHRKIVTSFRDHLLLSSMDFVLQLLESFVPKTNKNNNTITTNNNLNNKIKSNNELFSKNFTTTPIELPQEEGSFELIFETCLKLLCTILSFDFSGFGRVDVVGGTDTSQLSFPITWRKRIKIHEVLNLLFSLFFGCSTCDEPVIARLEVLIKCIELLSSIRDVIFKNEEDQISFLANLLYGTTLIAENNFVLLSENILHEYCRLSYKVITNHRFQTLISTSYLDPFITSIHQLSLICIENVTNLHSNHYLLSIWVKIVNEMGPEKLDPNNQGQNNSKNQNRNNSSGNNNKSFQRITEMVGKIVQEFIIKKIDFWGNNKNEIDFRQIYDLESDLMLEINKFKILGRVDYKKTFSYLIEFFDTISTNIQQNGLSENYFLQLSILIILSGSLISQTVTKPIQESAYNLGKGNLYVNFPESDLSYPSLYPEKKETLIKNLDNIGNNNNQKNYYFDAELTSRVIELIKWLDDLGNENENENENEKGLTLKCLELSFIYFFEQINIIYIYQHKDKFSTFFQIIPEILPNIESKYEQTILFIYLKIKNNLKKYSNDEHIIIRTLHLFDNFVDHYKAGKTLINFEEVDQLLKNHNTDNFPFLERFLSHSKIRVKYYKIIGKLLFLGSKEMQFSETFNNFIQIFDDSFGQLNQYFNDLDQQKQQSGQYEHGEGICVKALSLVKDLRGIISKCKHDWKFIVFFDWFYPSKVEILNNFFIYFKKIPEILNNLLKFWNEFASLTITKNGKNTSFHNSCSPNGIIIFKLICNSIQSFAQEFSNNFDYLPNEYSIKFKGLAICQSTISNLVQNSYVDLGVFEAFNDDCLQKTVQLIFEISESIDLQYIIINPKFTNSYYRLLEIFSQEYLEFIIQRPNENFSYLINIITDGLEMGRMNILEKSCIFIQSLFSFYHSYCQNKLLTNIKKKKLAQILLLKIQENEDKIIQIIRIIINSLIYHPKINVWALSKALLPLILIYSDAFSQLQQEIVFSLDKKKTEVILQLFEKISINVKDNLEPRNFSVFGQNLNNFRYKIRNVGYLF
ncbi:exportin [Anaeramoeba flamelloides]|uniref:Exportin n=1 Tax=Anaeramoeba flamelloides TaxID=1746091 RepID=A0AAV7ZH94_9EUKA|nr:exportin [Anaeramoeba flamelloides]